MKPLQPLIITQELSIVREGVSILQDISSTLYEGRYVAIVGPNGGGKTTFLKALLGLISPSQGHVNFLGDRARVGYVPQRLEMLDKTAPLSVEDVVKSGRAQLEPNQGAIEAALNRFDLERLRTRRFGELSGGERQRVLLARAMSLDPHIVALDEPTAFIDQKGEATVVSFLRELHAAGVTILLVSHDHDFVEAEAEEVWCINRTLSCDHHPRALHSHS